MNTIFIRKDDSMTLIVGISTGWSWSWWFWFLPWAWALVCSDGEGGAQGTTGCWERTPAPGGGGARPKNHLAKPPIRVLQSTAGSTETPTGQGVGGQRWAEGRRSRVSVRQGHRFLQREKMLRLSV